MDAPSPPDAPPPDSPLLKTWALCGCCCYPAARERAGAGTGWCSRCLGRLNSRSFQSWTCRAPWAVPCGGLGRRLAARCGGERLAGCWARCWARACGGRRRREWGAVVGPHDLENLLEALESDGQGELLLTKDVAVGDVTFPQGAALVRVGDRRRRRWGVRRRWVPDEIRQRMHRHVKSAESVPVSFQLQEGEPLHWPWCICVKMPCSLFLLTLLAVAALSLFGVGSALGRITLDTDMSSFMQADGPAALSWKALQQVRQEQQEASTASAVANAGKSRRLGTSDIDMPHFPFDNDVHLTFVATDGRDLLSPDTITAMRDIESQIRSLPSYQRLCDLTPRKWTALCASGVSLTNLAYPSVSSASGNVETLALNGTGTAQLPLALTVAWAQDSGVARLLLPSPASTAQAVDVVERPCTDLVKGCAALQADGQCEPLARHEAYMQDFCRATCGLCGATTADPGDVPAVGVQVIRSYFGFCGTSGADVFKALGKEVVSARRSVDHKEDPSGLRVLYNGAGFRTLEAVDALLGDFLLALAALGFTFVYSLFHTRSVILATLGLFLVLISLPATIAVYNLVVGSLKLNMMIGLSVFITVGTGAKTIFMYADFWRQSAEESARVTDRLKFTYVQAATNTGASTLTTVVSFWANLNSAMRPLREFGFFMGVNMALIWIIVLVGFPPLLLVAEALHDRVREMARRHKEAKSAAQPEEEDPVRKTVRQVTSGGAALVERLMTHDRQGASSKLGVKLARTVVKFRCRIIVGFVVLTIAALIQAALNFQQDMDPPKIFRADSNQALNDLYDPLFASYDRIGAYQIFQPRTRCSDPFSDCSLHRCDTKGRRVGSFATCPCFLRTGAGPPGGQTCNSYRVDLRVVGRQGLQASHVVYEAVGQLLRAQLPNATSVSLPSSGPPAAKPFHATNWETGRDELAQLVTVPRISVAMPAQPGGVGCTLREVCYCDVEVCEGWAGAATGLGSLALNRSSAERVLSEVRQAGVRDVFGGGMHGSITPPSNEGRTLQSDSFAFLVQSPVTSRQDQAGVMFVAGIQATGVLPVLGEPSTNFYRFDDTIRFEDPWMQRVGIDMCQSFPANLRVTTVICWITGFRDYWVAKGEEWPIRPEKWDVHTQVLTYASNNPVQVISASGVTSGAGAAQYVFFGSDNKVKAMYVEVGIDMAATSSAGRVTEYMKDWKSFTDGFNQAVQNKLNAQWKAWHTSSMWVRIEAEHLILLSTAETLILSLVLVLFGVFLFTRNLWLAMIVMVVVAAIIICLFWFMVYAMGWKIGGVEVLSLIIFVGFSVDYSLHIAHKYHSCHVTTEEEDGDGGGLPDALEEDGDDERLDCEDYVYGDDDVSDAPRHHSRGRRRSSKRVSLRCQDTHPLQTHIRRSTHRETASAAADRVFRAAHRSVEREQRTKFALERMGGCVAGSAVTIVGCGLFLLPCEIFVFYKIGAVICAVSALAIIFALLPLPAVLILCGPCNHDFQTILQLIWKCFVYFWPEEVDYGEEDVFDRSMYVTSTSHAEDEGANAETVRRQFYVLHMPRGGVAQIASRGNARRTGIVANG